ncbi:L-aspartate oxidase [Heyndrickxia acidiproducens]|uniref:L-aspartate oxidase n=1 Tax=Heyndrickxia acidiproducens TaxID=1121084 RepID=UPI0003828DFC|nr:L-aspartate oxidase [Heyndrickxia acidiproducens]
MKENIIIIGSGIAALQLANHLSDRYNVIIITKSAKKTSNSYKAQGGIAAVLSPEDRYESHIQDTLMAGRYHHANEEVEKLVKEGTQAVKALIASGLPVDRLENGGLDLGLEGAHHVNRILHCGGDATGKYVIEQLLMQLGKKATFIEHELAFELMLSLDKQHVIGVKTKSKSGEVKQYFGSHIVLATGGIGSLYPYTSNHAELIGDGIAMAYRAGAELADLEFVQFHPTLLFVNGRTKGLISEAVRGEGAILVDEDGNKIMAHAHPLKDLAPRHVVAHKIYQTLKQQKKVFLDIRNLEHFEERFPTITEICRQSGIDIHSGLLPVAPGSHFFMGGILVDTFGRTTVHGLYAIGETACSGVHGANRLASNSLLEGLVFGKRLAVFLNSHAPVHRSHDIVEDKRQPLSSKLLDRLNMVELKKAMMERIGIIREETALQAHLEWLKSLNVNEFFQQSLDHLSREEIEKVFMFTNSCLIAQSALFRTESRGAHIRSDYPEERGDWKDQYIVHSIAKGIRIRRGFHEQNQTSVHA